MLPDHYATLGVAHYSPPADIRAAYLELIRRYHPDTNPSAVAAARVRAITAAYAVIGTEDKRVAYDLQRAQLVLAENSMFAAPRRRPATPFVAACFGVAVVLTIPLLVSPPPVQSAQYYPIESVGDQQRAPGREQVDVAPDWNLTPARPAERLMDSASLSRGSLTSTLPSVENTSGQATNQTGAPAALGNAIENQRHKRVAQPRSRLLASRAIVSRAKTIRGDRKVRRFEPAAHGSAATMAEAPKASPSQEPLKPAWQRPLPPIQPAWQRPLPPAQSQHLPVNKGK